MRVTLVYQNDEGDTVLYGVNISMEQLTDLIEKVDEYQMEYEDSQYDDDNE